MKPAYIVIGVLILVIVYLQQCRVPHWKGKYEECIGESGVIDTIYRDTGRYIIDSVPYPKKVYLPGDTVWQDSIVTIIDSIPVYIDTTEVINDYFALKEYRDTFEQSEVYVSLFEKVQRNEIIDRRVTIQNLRSTEITHENALKNRIMVGGFVGGEPFAFGPQLGLLTKQHNLYSYGYDIGNNSHRITLMTDLFNR